MTNLDKVNEIKKMMKEKNIDAYIIPSGDCHQSEYVSEHWKFRDWVSGFTGSAGTLVITLEESGLWTDGRYHIQAEKQLKGSGINLFKQGLKDVPTYIDWLEKNLKEEAIIGFDPKTFSQSNFKKLDKDLSKKKIKYEYLDIADVFWKDRPEIKFEKIFNHDIKFSGYSVSKKLEMVRKEMKESKVDNYILGSLDDIAWLFNIRGSDIPKNPVVMSYALITFDKARIFLQKEKLGNDTFENLKNNNVEIFNYDEMGEEIENLDQNSYVYIDPNKLNHYIYNKIPKSCVVIEKTNITTNLKAVKNEVELNNLINCQTRDGVAMVKFIYWLKNNVGKEKITEISADKKLEAFRSEQEYFVSPSFDTIAGYMDHAAMMHYKATEENQYELKNKGLLLVDSGGQYFDGTTDITRTIVLGDLTEEEKRDFTLVLKSHIGLCSAKFLYGTTGSNLDILARYPLWKEGIDYKCGTGHGIGYFLNVHEGPQGFSQVPSSVKLEKNMVTTVEPGIYRENKHGIRTENTVVIVDDSETEFGQFLKFRTISYCPIDLDGIYVEMLETDEKIWLNDYHKEVYKRLSPFLDEETKEWLKENTKEI